MATRGELPHRVFFTSGREELEERVRERVVAGGREERRAEFRRLERLLAASLSSTLVATKYSAHAATGAAACRQLGDLYRGLLEAGARCQVPPPALYLLQAAWTLERQKLVTSMEATEAEMAEVAAELRGEIEVRWGGVATATARGCWRV